MRNTLFVVFFVLVANSYINGQEANSSPKGSTNISLRSITQIGAIKGEKEGVAMSIQFINGIRVNTWFAGIGAGVDDYEYRSIPVFLDVRKYLQGNLAKFFLYADGGISFPWVYKEEKEFSNYVFKRGLYADAGIGYSFKIGKANALMLSGGYSVKKLKKGKTDFYLINGRTVFEKPNLYYYEFKTILFKLGFQF